LLRNAGSGRRIALHCLHSAHPCALSHFESTPLASPGIKYSVGGSWKFRKFGATSLYNNEISRKRIRLHHRGRGLGRLCAGGKLRLKTGDWYHQLHHQYFNLNYGNTPTPFDKLFGSWHDGSRESLQVQKQRIRGRRRQAT
jgi:hypothetical protein